MVYVPITVDFLHLNECVGGWNEVVPVIKFVEGSSLLLENLFCWYLGNKLNRELELAQSLSNIHVG